VKPWELTAHGLVPEGPRRHDIIAVLGLMSHVIGGGNADVIRGDMFPGHSDAGLRVYP
jgi:hypothetical protein